jgi:hypothetical protein
VSRLRGSWAHRRRRTRGSGRFGRLRTRAEWTSSVGRCEGSRRSGSDGRRDGSDRCRRRNRRRCRSGCSWSGSLKVVADALEDILSRIVRLGRRRDWGRSLLQLAIGRQRRSAGFRLFGWRRQDGGRRNRLHRDGLEARRGSLRLNYGRWGSNDGLGRRSANDGRFGDLSRFQLAFLERSLRLWHGGERRLGRCTDHER